VARGDLGDSADGILYPDPVGRALAAVTVRSAEIRSSTDRALDELARMVGALPQLLRDWSVGEATDDPVPVQVRHGPNASEDLWYDTARHDSGVLSVVFPLMGRFLEIDDEDRMTRFAIALQGKDAVRVIVPAGAADVPAAADLIARYRGVGVQVRAMADPPSWFWVDGEQLAVPYEWGEGSPTSVLGVRNAALAALAAGYFDVLWRESVEVGGLSRTWTPLLRLMQQGATLDGASRMLGINPRTGGRRVSAAMEYYGVSTLFALGVAWSADAS
jgi:hypothetical protein